MRIGTRIGFGFVAALAAVTITAVLTWIDASELTRSAQSVDHTNDVLRALDQVQTDLIDVETGDRSFAIVGREEYLEPFVQGTARVESDLARLAMLVRDDGDQSRRVAALGLLIHARIEHASAVVGARRARGFGAAAALISAGEGLRLMNQARIGIAAVQQQELRLLAIRTNHWRDHARATHRVAVISPVAMALLAILAAALLTRSLTRPLRALVATARRLGRGESVRVADENRPDEIGDLARALDEMADQRARAEARTRELIQDAGEAFFLADLDGKYVDVNAAACSLVGYERERLIGKTIADLLDPEDLGRLASAREFLLQPGAVHVAEWPLRHADGRVIPVEVTAKILPDGRWQAFCRDVSERKAVFAERERLLAAERRVRHQLELIRESSIAISGVESPSGERHLPAVMQTIVDEAMRLTSADVAAFGIGTDPSKPFDPWVWKGFSDQEIERLARAPHPIGLLGAATHAGETVLIGQLASDPRAAEVPYGQPALASYLGVAIRHHGCVVGSLHLGKRQGAAPFGSDDRAVIELLSAHAATAIESARLYDEVQTAVRAREDTLAVVSHDLRNPLNAIALRAQLLAREAPAGKQALHAEAIRKSVHSMNQLIRGLLDEASIEAGSLRLDIARFSLAEAAATLFDSVAPVAAQRHIRLECQVPESSWVDADRERVLQILSNLVANAIRYTPPGGVVTIRTERAGGETRIAVADTGPGVPADVVPHVFERYFTTARREGGTGLGLYIVKGLVEAHGGRVWLETEPGNGTTFYFSLPDRIAVSAAHHA